MGDLENRTGCGGGPLKSDHFREMCKLGGISRGSRLSGSITGRGCPSFPLDIYTGGRPEIANFAKLYKPLLPPRGGV